MFDSGRAQKVFSRSGSPLLYYITDRNRLGSQPLLAVTRRIISAGIDFIQIREKDLSDRQLFELTRRVMEQARGTRCRVLVNGRADVAMAAGAHGVHLPSRSFRITELRSWTPGSFIIGKSVHSLREARAAVEQGADYLLLGPIYRTESKIQYGAPLGMVNFRRICSQIPLPVFGLGGILPETMDAVMQGGAVGVAGIGLFQGHHRKWLQSMNRNRT